VLLYQIAASSADIVVVLVSPMPPLCPETVVGFVRLCTFFLQMGDADPFDRDVAANKALGIVQKREKAGKGGRKGKKGKRK
jgi:hypothetical protein